MCRGLLSAETDECRLQVLICPGYRADWPRVLKVLRLSLIAEAATARRLESQRLRVPGDGLGPLTRDDHKPLSWLRARTTHILMGQVRRCFLGARTAFLVIVACACRCTLELRFAAWLGCDNLLAARRLLSC